MVQAKSSNASETKPVAQNSRRIRSEFSLLLHINKKVGSRVIKNNLYFKSDKKASNSGRQIITLHIVNTLQYEINDYQVKINDYQVNFIYTLVP